MKLAIYQCAGHFLDVSANLELLAQTAINAAAQGADFLVLPELFLSGYNVGDDISHVAEAQDGSAIARACQIANENSISLLFGYIERADQQFYNSAALIDETGRLVGNYRKTHLFGSEEQRLFYPGDRWVVHDIAGVRVGVLICFDVEFPEAVRTLALQGAQLIAVPTAIMPPFFPVPSVVVPSRAFENQVFVAYVNRVGEERGFSYFGLSCVVDPAGKDLVRMGVEESLQLVEIDTRAIAPESMGYDYLNERRPELYAVLEPVGQPKSNLAC
jgi:5-aminopentanamidase